MTLQPICKATELVNSQSLILYSLDSCLVHALGVRTSFYSRWSTVYLISISALKRLLFVFSSVQIVLMVVS